jgi:hypothetical protein
VSSPVIPDKAVRRFTTEYVVVEDRLRLALERGDGSIATLWLTRRLLRRLVVHIVKVIDTLPRLRAGAGGGGKVSPPSDNVQRRNQLEALGKIEQQAPVLGGTLPDGLESHLITALGVRMTKRAVLIDCKVGEEIVQTLPFSEAELRQWLSVLHQNFRKAEWVEDIWPKWITAKGWDQGPDALRLN